MSDEYFQEEEDFVVVPKCRSGTQKGKLHHQKQQVVERKSYASAAKSQKAVFGERARISQSPRQPPVVKVAVVSKGFPLVRLTEDQSTALQDVLIDMIEPSDDGEPLQVIYVYCDDGAVIFTCANAWTATWLEETIPKLTPWAGANLKVGPVGAMLRKAKVMVWIPKFLRDLKTTRDIVKLIESDNVISIASWKTVSRKDVEEGSSLVISINERSFRQLKALKFKVNFGTSQLTFKPISKPPGYN